MTTLQSTPLRTHSLARDVFVLLAFLVLCQGVGIAGALVTDPSAYTTLARPAWAPPSWLFGPVWTALYGAMAVAGFLLWRAPEGEARARSLGLFTLQLVLNGLWSPVFFGLGRIGGAFVVIVALLVTLLVCLVRFPAVSKPAAWLFVPYVAWVAFATALNGSLWAANR